MALFGFRDNKFTAKNLEAKEQMLVKKELAFERDTSTAKSVNYITLRACAVGTATSANRYAYLFLGTGGRLCLSSTAPVGTTGAFANKGQSLGTTA